MCVWVRVCGCVGKEIYRVLSGHRKWMFQNIYPLPTHICHAWDVLWVFKGMRMIFHIKALRLLLIFQSVAYTKQQTVCSGIYIICYAPFLCWWTWNCKQNCHKTQRTPAAASLLRTHRSYSVVFLFKSRYSFYSSRGLNWLILIKIHFTLIGNS